MSCSTTGVPARVVLGVLSFLMFLVTQMIRVNLHIAVVQMVDALSWTNRDTAWLLGAFYFSYWMTELPGGLLAQRLGGRRVLGVGVAIAGLLTLAMPPACRAHYWVAVVTRAAQGLALGVTWPAMHALSAHWIPATERSKFMVSYHGAAVGSALVFPLSGQLMATLGWEAVFYVTGALALVWSLAWWTLVTDSPDDHPRISQQERDYLRAAIGDSVASKKKVLSPPWCAILRSPPFWATLLASQGIMWGVITLSMQLPAYFSAVHGLDYRTNGLILALPELCKFLFGLGFSALIDSLLRRGVLTITCARKISVATNEFIPAVLLACLGYLAADCTSLAVALLAASAAASGASASGNLANVVDLSPNFAGTLLGMIKTSSVLPGVVSPLVASMLVTNQVQGWRHVFAVAAAIHVVCCTVFLVLGSGEVQPWNTPPDDDVEERDEEVTQPLAPDEKILGA